MYTPPLDLIRLQHRRCVQCAAQEDIAADSHLGIAEVTREKVTACTRDGFEALGRLLVEVAPASRLCNQSGRSTPEQQQVARIEARFDALQIDQRSQEHPANQQQ